MKVYKYLGWKYERPVRATATNRKSGSVKGKWNEVAWPPDGTVGMIISYGHDTPKEATEAIREKIRTVGAPKLRKFRASGKKPAKNPSGGGFLRLINPEEKTERRPLLREPVNMNDQIGAELGRVLDITLPDTKAKFSRSKPRLIWFPKIKALGWFLYAQGDKIGPKPKWMKPHPTNNHLLDVHDEIGDIGPAGRTFEAFMGRVETQAYSIKFPFRSTRGWYSINKVEALDYWSDKKSSRASYTHKMGPGVRLYIYGSPRKFGPSFWLVRGGALNVTERGLIN